MVTVQKTDVNEKIRDSGTAWIRARERKIKIENTKNNCANEEKRYYCRQTNIGPGPNAALE
jgi:hypothetical protein